MRIAITLDQETQDELVKTLEAAPFANRGHILTQAIKAGVHSVHQDVRATTRGGALNVLLEKYHEVQAWKIAKGLASVNTPTPSRPVIGVVPGYLGPTGGAITDGLPRDFTGTISTTGAIEGAIFGAQVHLVAANPFAAEGDNE